MDVLGGVFSTTPPVVAQLFSDVGGYLFGAEFLGQLAALITQFLTGIVVTLLGGFLGLGT